MATRSTITLATPKGYDSIYCHYDGYPSHVGKILKQYYNTEDKVKELIALGSLSSLDKHLAPEEGVKHTWDKPASDVTVAYHRDRGEDTLPNVKYYDTLYQVYWNGEEYNYVFEDGEWKLLVEENYRGVLKPFNTNED